MNDPEINWLATRRDGITFLDCLMMAAQNGSLLREFDRRRGTNLSLQGAPIEIAVDEASGRLNHDLKLFIEFVWNDIFLRMP